MRKLLLCLITFCIIISFSSCGNKKTDNEDKSNISNSQSQSGNNDNSHNSGTSNENDLPNSDTGSGNNQSSENGRHVCEYNAHTRVFAPTCEKEGYTLHICICGKTKETNKTERIGHDWTTWTVSLEPTHTSNGELTRICANGHNDTKPIPPLNLSDYTVDFINNDENAVSCNTPVSVYYIYNNNIYDDATSSAKIFKFASSYSLDHSYSANYKYLADVHYISCDNCGYFDQDSEETHSFVIDKCRICGYTINQMVYSKESYGLAVSYSANEESAVIPEIYDGYERQYIDKNITAIKSFGNNEALKSITIPSSIKYIAPYAFDGCTSLKNVYYSGDWKDWCSIDFGRGSNPMNYATEFYMLDGYGTYQRVDKIELPDSLESISDGAFEGFENITSLVIPKSVTSFGNGINSVFSENTTIGRVYYNADYTDWCNIAIPLKLSNPMQFTNNFYMRNANGKYYTPTQITIPDSIKEIGNYQFTGLSALITLTLNSDLTRIGNYAFSDCISLCEVDISNGCSELGAYAFNGCSSLTKLSLPKTLTVSGEFSFCGCEWISSVYFKGGLNDWCNIEFKNAESTPLYSNKNRNYDSAAELYFYNERGEYYSPESQMITLPLDLKDIGRYQFFGFSKISGFIISDGTKSIGQEAFAFCTNTRIIVIPKSIIFIDKNVVSGINNSEIYYGGSDDDWNAVTIDSENKDLNSIPRYYFAENASTLNTKYNFWGYTESGIIAKWRYDTSTKEWYLL